MPSSDVPVVAVFFSDLQFVMDRDFEDTRDKFGRISVTTAASKQFNPAGPSFPSMRELLLHVDEVFRELVKQPSMYA